MVVALVLTLMLQTVTPLTRDVPVTYQVWYCPRHYQLWVRHNVPGDMTAWRGDYHASPYPWEPQMNGTRVEEGTAAVCRKRGEDPNKEKR
jgi:hypothetical protein